MEVPQSQKKQSALRSATRNADSKEKRGKTFLIYN